MRDAEPDIAGKGYGLPEYLEDALREAEEIADAAIDESEREDRHTQLLPMARGLKNHAEAVRTAVKYGHAQAAAVEMHMVTTLQIELLFALKDKDVRMLGMHFVYYGGEQIASAAASGRRYSLTQAAKGSKGGRARWSGNEAREAVDRMVTTLAARRDELGDPEKPSELWPHLCSMMETAGLNPRELGDPSRYECDGLEQAYTYEAFRKRIRRLRED